MGDGEAWREVSSAWTAGRYRITDTASVYARTRGGDIDATIPDLMEELRGSCCKAGQSGGQAWSHLFDVDSYPRDGNWRTPYERARRLWQAGKGPGGPGFVWSRIQGRYVLGAR
jgi:hypothetical protein